MIRTVTLTADTEMHVSLGIGDHVSITNKSATASLYAAAASDVVAGEDGVIEIAAGMNSLLPDCKGEVYLLSSDAAEVQLISTNALNANFNKAARGGESGGSPLQDIIINQSIVWTTSIYSTVIDMSAHKEKYRYYIIELPINSTLNSYIGLNYGETGTTTQIYKLSTTAGQTGVETNTSGATASAKISTGYIACSTYKAYAKIDCVGVIGFSEINGDIINSPDPLNIAYTSTNGINNIHIYNSVPQASTFTLKIYGVK